MIEPHEKPEQPDPDEEELREFCRIPDDDQWDGDSRRGRKKKTFEVE